MKRKTVTVTREYDKEGNLTYETTETIEEEDSGYIYPQSYDYHRPQQTDWSKWTCSCKDTTKW